jgi:3-dehydroquinate synthase
MSAPAKIRVELASRGYDIVVGAGLFERAGEWLGPVLREKRLFVVTDERVAAAQWPRLARGLREAGISAQHVSVPAGEASKDFAHLEKVLNAVLEQRPERGSMLLALGGGVVGDLTGLAASLLLRGVDFIQAPTTLLAQVDSGVGGKTGINTRHGKNLVGTFHQPRLVLTDLDTLTTLPRRELLAGYAEVVKYGLIDEPEFFAWLEANGARLIAGDIAARAYAVEQGCRAKARIVAADERETAQRALLNLGHTFGHALEATLGYGNELLHGEGVAIGMTLAFDMSVRLGLAPAADAARVRRHLAAVGLPTRPPGLHWDVDRLLALMAQDKKVRDGRITFVLVRGIGKAFLARDVDTEVVRAVLQQAVAA